MKESKYKKELAEFDVEKAYKTEEVMGMLKSQPKRKFTESVDVAVKLGIDPKKIRSKCPWFTNITKLTWKKYCSSSFCRRR
jgi:ribosomal protein L1